MTGSDQERRLVNALTACGRTAMRAPASGAATDADLPDVIAGTPVAFDSETLSDVWAIELKATSSTTAYAETGEVHDLRTFAEAFGATPFVAGYFKRPGTRSAFYLVEPDHCRFTDGGNYGVPESDVDERASHVVYPSTASKPAELDGVVADA